MWPFVGGDDSMLPMVLDMKLNALDLLLAASWIGGQVLGPFLTLELLRFLKCGQVARRILIICDIICGQFSHINIAVALPIRMLGFLITQA